MTATGRVGNEATSEEARELGWAADARSDRAAFAPLYDRYAGPVYRYCYRRLGAHEAAEDATSQTFFKALAAIDRFEGGSFRAWLFTIADRTVTDVLRRRRPRASLDDAGELVDMDSGPEERALAAAQANDVQALVAALPGEQRRVVALRLAGLTGPEIASVLGIGHGAVKSLQFRAFARLRKLMGDDDRW